VNETGVADRPASRGSVSGQGLLDSRGVVPARSLEFIAPENRRFQPLVRGREEPRQDLTAEVFEKFCTRHFENVRQQQVENTARSLYLLRKRGSAG
jgi:hypothetical protein